MDPEFTKILIRVSILGGSLMLIGGTALYFAIRAYRKGEFTATVILAAVIAFVLACCVALLLLSIPR